MQMRFIVFVRPSSGKSGGMDWDQVLAPYGDRVQITERRRKELYVTTTREIIEDIKVRFPELNAIPDPRYHMR